MNGPKLLIIMKQDTWYLVKEALLSASIKRPMISLLVIRGLQFYYCVQHVGIKHQSGTCRSTRNKTCTEKVTVPSVTAVISQRPLEYFIP